MKVGLTGGYASGKSSVAAELERLGCHVIYADRLGHAVLEAGSDAYEQTVREFGRDILSEDGTIDRRKLASIAFADAARLAALNSIVHPAVFRLEEEMQQQFATEDPEGIVVLEAAILIETGHYKAFDRLIVTFCSLEAQIARGMSRDHLNREEVLARVEKQIPLEEKRKYADYVIDTDGPKLETMRQVRSVYQQIREGAGRSA